MASRVAPAPKTVGSWFGKAASPRPWLHAVVAFLVGAIFGLFLRNSGIAALFSGGAQIGSALAIVLVAAVGFGALGRAFTGRNAGWLLVLTAGLWAPAVVIAAFVLFTSDGEFHQDSPIVPLVGGIAAGLVALLAWGGPVRWLALIAMIVAGFAVITPVFAGS